MGRSLMQALALAVMDMRRRRNECLTLEHVLLAMTHERIGRIILEGLGVDLAELRHALDEHLTRYLPALEEGAVLEVVQSPAVERALERALMHMQSAGRSRAEVGDLLAAMYEEEDSFAVYFLRRQGISRLDILDFISHDLPQIVHEQSFEADIARVGEARRRAEGEEGESGEGQENRKASALEKYTRDLVELARSGRIDPLVGRENEVSRVMEVLSRRRKNNPLLVGEPGTGKTAVAAYAGWLCAGGGFQAALMAPTEVLAEQHYRSLSALLAPAGVRVGLLTGSMTAAEKKKTRTALARGEIGFVVGTHALISDGVEFANLALIVADEQHRFGVAQRMRLSGKGGEANVLVMSATPIPRTMALIVYGDLELSIMDELPPGRQKIDTYYVGGDKRQRALNYIKKHLDAGYQGYIRPDHGRRIWGEKGGAGYGLYDRALGAAYLNGLWEAIQKNAKKGERHEVK